MSMLYQSVKYFLLFMMFLSGCSKEELSPVDYVKWMEEEGNGLRKSKKMDQVEFRVQYKTEDYMLLKESNILPYENEALYENEKNNLGGMQYFTFKICVPEAVDPLKFKLTGKEEYYARVKYYSFDAQEDFLLVDGEDTLSCMLSHFERNYGVAPEITFLLGFPPLADSKNIADKSLIFYDRVFNSGHLIFNFSKKDLNKIPKLKS